MEFEVWECILMEWVDRLEFVEPCHNLQLPDIESFYNVFKENVTATNISNTNLDSFFKGYYPQFQPSHNKEGKICPDEYIFCYSLLLLFSCVTKPDIEMHKICNRMDSRAQSVLTTFFGTMAGKNYNKDAIETAIEASVPAKMAGYALALSANKSKQFDVMPPPTPKTKDLDKLTKENRHLKALLDTEYYDKGCLEQQLKEKDEFILKENRKFMEEINNLRHQLAEADMGTIPLSIPPNENPLLESLKRSHAEMKRKDEELQKVKSELEEAERCRNSMSIQLSIAKARLGNKSNENCPLEKEVYALEEPSNVLAQTQLSDESFEDSYLATIANQTTTSIRPESMDAVVELQLQLEKRNNANLQEEIEILRRRIENLEAKLRDYEVKAPKATVTFANDIDDGLGSVDNVEDGFRGQANELIDDAGQEEASEANVSFADDSEDELRAAENIDDDPNQSEDAYEAAGQVNEGIEAAGQVNEGIEAAGQLDVPQYVRRPNSPYKGITMEQWNNAPEGYYESNKVVADGFTYYVSTDIDRQMRDVPYVRITCLYGKKKGGCKGKAGLKKFLFLSKLIYKVVEVEEHTCKL